uniref:VWFA domain-containing protein n=1 Tax=Amphiprion ocellaris TaxID=80972 RepID=A0A3Q1B2X3_AMPOC
RVIILVYATIQDMVVSALVKNSCKAIPLDFVFVIDSSRSIRPNDYEKVKTFIINLLQFLEVGSDATRIGLLQYGSVVQPEFSLNTYTTKAEVEQAVRNMKHLASGTMTGLAIQYTMETAFTEEQGARPKSLHIPRIAMIVTDGRPQDTVEEIAAETREAGIQIFAIGVGRVDMNTLKTIGSEPHLEHVHLVANFSQIETLISVFQSKLCGAEDTCAVVDHGCQHICANLPDGYECRCRSGYQLTIDNKTCNRNNTYLTHLFLFCQWSQLLPPFPLFYLLKEKTTLLLLYGADLQKVVLRPSLNTIKVTMIHSLKNDYSCCSRGTDKSCTSEHVSMYIHKITGSRSSEIDYCDLGNHGCEHNCVSVPESYICRCNKGYILNLDGKTCSSTCFLSFCNQMKEMKMQTKHIQKNIDHCADGTHGCEQEFMNTADSCLCKCRKGYTLRPDGKTCKKIDHCADGTHGCEQEFMNTEDSCVCKCRKGYTLRPDGKTCKKIDHCSDGTHGCEQEFMNTEDSCVCKCRKGYTLRPDGKTCKSNDGIMDLVFVIDGSKSLGPANFELVKQFVNGIVDSLNISRMGTHVGLLQYSTKVRTEFTLNQYSTARDIKQAVTRMQYMGRGSMTGSALRHMYEFSFSAKEGARPNTPRVSIVFTDGRSQDDVSEWATKAKNSGVTIYTLGVGKAIEQELREIASEPDEKHLYYAEDFEKMGEITKKLKSRICTGTLHEAKIHCQTMTKQGLKNTKLEMSDIGFFDKN